MLILIKKETVTREDNTNLAILQDTLDTATSYFALSIIPIQEWFDPAAQVYLAKLLNRKLASNGFDHERTLLFFSKKEYENSLRPLMDERYYGASLARLHKDCGIRLSFLQRGEIFDLLRRLAQTSATDIEALRCYPQWMRWKPIRFMHRLPLHWLRRRIPHLDFALAEQTDGTRSILRIAKRGEEIRIGEEITGKDAQPYERLIELIKDKVHKRGSAELNAAHDFVRIYYP